VNQEAETHTFRVMVLEGIEESACHAHGWILVLIVIVGQDGNVSDSNQAKHGRREMRERTRSRGASSRYTVQGARRCTAFAEGSLRCFADWESCRI